MKCTYIKPNGERCEAFAIKNSQYCFTHDPSKKEERTLAVKKGGLVKKRILLDNKEEVMLNDLKDAKEFLSRLINDVWKGKIPATPVANTLGFLVRCFIEVYEKSELEERIRKLEEEITRKNSLDFENKSSYTQISAQD